MADTVRFLGAPRNGNDGAAHTPEQATVASDAAESEALTVGSAANDVDF